MLCCVSGKDMKTLTGSIQQPAMGMITPTKATIGSQWPGRVTEVGDYPLGLQMKAACCRRGGNAFSRMGSSSRACTSPGLSSAHTTGSLVLFSPCSTALSLHLGNVSRNWVHSRGCLILISMVKTLCHSWFQAELSADGAL